MAKPFLASRPAALPVRPSAAELAALVRRHPLFTARGGTRLSSVFDSEGCERRLVTAGGVARRASALEHEGMVQQWQREVCREARGVATSAQFISSEPVHFLQVAAEPQGEFAAALAAAHRE